MVNVMDYTFLDERFWVAFSFIILLGLVFRPLKKILLKVLDNRGARIKAELKNVENLRLEAEQVLLSYQNKQKAVLKEAQTILEQTEHKVQLMIQEAQAQLEADIAKKHALALQKIIIYEEAIIQNLKEEAINIAIVVLQKILNERLQNNTNEVDWSIAFNTINKKLH